MHSSATAPRSFSLSIHAVAWALLTLSQGARAQDFTGFVSPGPLAAAHADLEGLTQCVKCHQLGVGVTNGRCLDCHDTVQDQLNKNSGFHADKRDKRCASCHPDHGGRDKPMIRFDEADPAFNHDSTGYPLDGGHERIECRDCHKTPNKWTGLETTCDSCHDDPHGSSQSKRELLQDCGACHKLSAKSPVPIPRSVFDHTSAAATDYPLEGLHTDVKCEDCHKDALFVPTAHDSCESCHENPHGTQFQGRACASCHTVHREHFNLRSYDHSKTDFPLLGEHASVSCQRCHGKDKSARYLPLPHVRCDDCHKDPHSGQFQPRDCSECHGVHVADFGLAGFSHDQTNYPLSKPHAEASCEACHGKMPDAVFAKLPAEDCVACHEDPHDPTFQPAPCMTCHGGDDWSVQAFDHDRVRGSCLACHADEDFHEGSTDGNTCGSCHDPDAKPAWKVIRFEHEEETDFALEGRHEPLACADCHDVKDLRGNESTCVSCHEADRPDPHDPGECGECHTPASWREATLGGQSHDSTGFPLQGAHGRLVCTDCHAADAPRSAANPSCVSCHAAADPHRNLLGNQCDDCHSVATWMRTRFRHTETDFPLRGAHRIAACVDCHATAYAGTPEDCVRCHQRQKPTGGIHADPLTNDCAGCHSPYSWYNVSFPH